MSDIEQDPSAKIDRRNDASRSQTEDSEELRERGEESKLGGSGDRETSNAEPKKGGRPALGKERVTVYITPENKQWVEDVAERQYRKVSHVVDDIITEKREQSEED